MKNFLKKEIGRVTIFKLVKDHFSLESEEDLSGAYIFIHKGNCQYVGISDEVCRRIHQHLKGGNHFNASLAYLIAKRGFKAKGTRNEIMKLEGFDIRFKKAKKKISAWDLAVIEIQNPITRFIFSKFILRLSFLQNLISLMLIDSLNSIKQAYG
nr:GIY-YIG nuclease family protein [Leptospira yasudae]